jgi:hypothetical protein
MEMAEAGETAEAEIGGGEKAWEPVDAAVEAAEEA